MSGVLLIERILYSTSYFVVSSPLPETIDPGVQLAVLGAVGVQLAVLGGVGVQLAVPVPYNINAIICSFSLHPLPSPSAFAS